MHSEITTTGFGDTGFTVGKQELHKKERKVWPPMRQRHLAFCSGSRTAGGCCIFDVLCSAVGPSNFCQGHACGDDTSGLVYQMLDGTGFKLAVRVNPGSFVRVCLIFGNSQFCSFTCFCCARSTKYHLSPDVGHSHTRSPKAALNTLNNP